MQILFFFSFASQLDRLSDRPLMPDDKMTRSCRLMDVLAVMMRLRLAEA